MTTQTPIDARARAAYYLIHVHKSSTRDPDGSPDTRSGPIEARIARYTPARKRALAIADYLSTLDPYGEQAAGRDLDVYVQDLRQCGNWLEFEDYREHDTTRLCAAHFCNRYRLCPLCAIRRVARTLRDNCPKVATQYQAIKAQVPTATLMLGTWTIRNGPDLAERHQHLRQSWYRLLDQRRKYLHWLCGGRSRARAYTETSQISGGIWTIEFKRGSGSAQWHPHLHAALICDQPLSPHALSREWHEITGDSHVVDVRPFHSIDSTQDDFVQSLGSDLVEVLKYPLKFADIDLADNWHAETVLAGKRLRASFGCLYGIGEVEDLLDEPMDLDDLPYIPVAAEWCGSEYKLHTLLY